PTPLRSARHPNATRALTSFLPPMDLIAKQRLRLARGCGQGASLGGRLQSAQLGTLLRMRPALPLSGQSGRSCYNAISAGGPKRAPNRIDVTTSNSKSV